MVEQRSTRRADAHGTTQGSKNLGDRAAAPDRNAIDTDAASYKSEREPKRGLFNRLNLGTKFSHGSSDDSARVGSTKKDDRHGRGHGMDVRKRGADSDVDASLPYPPDEAEEAPCANNDCRLEHPERVIYINPKTEQPYEERFRRRPEICGHCGRIWPENKPFSKKMKRQAEERLDKSKYRGRFFCEHCEPTGSDRGVEEDMNNRNERGKKRALLIGVSYDAQKGYGVPACKENLQHMKDFLHNRGYDKVQDMKILMEDWSRYRHPTREDILRGMDWLVEGARPGDSLFLHYFGFGNGSGISAADTTTGKEGIYPVDHLLQESKGLLTDEVMRDKLANIPEGVQLIAIFDSYHSGSVLDLPYKYDEREHAMIATNTRHKKKVSDNHGTVIVWNCVRKSADMVQSLGSMSRSFIKANQRLETSNHGSYTYRELHRFIREYLKREPHPQKAEFSSNKPFASDQVYM